MKKYKNVVLFLLIVLVFSLTIRINTLPVLVDGRSMEPTLYDHDFFLSNRNSIKSLKRFDIVVAYSHQLNENIVKRVIGMPFDKMEYRDNKLYINGQYI
ncbi:MAG TPA: signal peptidase I, partial [Erysipelotrichaceae bacterium]|nr:signal peptidase I [Erysipelotrichaceae bacterium]